MKNWIKVVVGCVCLASFVGCMPVMSPVAGSIYLDVSGPLTATSAERGSKTGVATAKRVPGHTPTLHAILPRLTQEHGGWIGGAELAVRRSAQWCAANHAGKLAEVPCGDRQRAAAYL